MSEQKMNPEVKARWVAALRSGEYKQTTGVLRRRSKHCCLGVLCDLYAKEAGIQWSPATLGSQADGNFDSEGTLPGAQVTMWSGLSTNWSVRIGRKRDELAVLNDEGATFAEIADAIEAQL